MSRIDRRTFLTRSAQAAGAAALAAALPESIRRALAVEPTHIGAAGAQTRVEHTPLPLQLWVSAQAEAAHERPSAAQTSRPVREPETQRAVPGVQMRVWHVPPLQLSEPPHDTVE